MREAALRTLRREAAHRWAVRTGAALVLVLLSAEFATRSLYAEQLRLRAYPLVYEGDPRLGYRYVPGAKGRLCKPSICREFEIQPTGFPAPDFRTEKAAGHYRIAVVGTSNATGIWMSNGRSYPVLLQERLVGQGLRVEVINLSIDGRFRAEAMLHLARRAVNELGSDLVLWDAELPLESARVGREVYHEFVIFYDLDAPEHRLREGRRIVDWIREHPTAVGLYERSYLLRAVVHVYHRAGHAPGRSLVEALVTRKLDLRPPGYVRLSPSESASRFRCLNKELDGRLILLSIAESRTARIAKRFRLPHFTVPIAGLPGLWHEHDGHLNAEGHERISESVAASLTGDQLPRTLGQGWLDLPASCPTSPW